MGFFDFLKKNEFAEIAKLKNELSDKEQQITFLSDRINMLSKYQAIVDIDAKIKELLDQAQNEASVIISKAQREADNLIAEANRINRLAEDKLSNSEILSQSRIDDAIPNG